MEMAACGASSLFFAAAGDFVPVLGVFPGRFVAVGVFCPGFWGISRMFCCCWRILSRFRVDFRDVLLLWGYFVLVLGVFSGCFVAARDFVLEIGA